MQKAILFALTMLLLGACGQADLECNDLHEGTFEYLGFHENTASKLGIATVITRKGAVQVEQEKDGEWREELKVEWRSDCKYILFGGQGDLDTTFVTITNISGNAYDFRCRNNTQEWTGRLIKTSTE